MLLVSDDFLFILTGDENLWAMCLLEPKRALEGISSHPLGTQNTNKELYNKPKNLI
jgi:hypothetical protein